MMKCQYIPEGMCLIRSATELSVAGSTLQRRCVVGKVGILLIKYFYTWSGAVLLVICFYLENVYSCTLLLVN
jgi:hypothetical protein